MTVRVRFAPSPTGKIHVGNGRTAMANKLFALKTGGTFILRFEDTDIAREVQGAEQQIMHDLNWLGFTSEENPVLGGHFGPYRTNERSARGDYQIALEKLAAKGLIYECFVSKDELDMLRKIQTSQGLPPRYDNRHRSLTPAEKEAYRAKGRKPVIRFKMDEEAIIEFTDLVRGPVRFEAKNLGGDPVLIRDNGVPLFTFAGVVDDINQQITHVIRGEDHVNNTALQVLLFQALGATPPHFAHMPMLLDTDGGKLSKRLDSLSITQLKADGYLPQAIVSYMASLGVGDAPVIGDMQTIANAFDFTRMGRAAVRFDIDQLNRVNAQFLHQLPFEEALPLLKPFVATTQVGTTRAGDSRLQAFWYAVRENLVTLADVTELFNTCFSEMTCPALSADDAGYVAYAESKLPAGPYDATTWGQWVNTLKADTGRKGKALFMPLRLALTGQEHGPELANLLPVLGEDVLRQRLIQAAAGAVAKAG